MSSSVAVVKNPYQMMYSKKLRQSREDGTRGGSFSSFLFMKQAPLPYSCWSTLSYHRANFYDHDHQHIRSIISTLSLLASLFQLRRITSPVPYAVQVWERDVEVQN
ncbi:hypothetical protein [Absidia glauca]|uniref:Uncharacterized protein n=1 Tax=Absidia glauca TaxID=4829 RepID=A0A168RT43_ABSGL|nr:hypothetical protein [Absidia glauca]